jgi:hypothetical protein
MDIIEMTLLLENNRKENERSKAKGLASMLEYKKDISVALESYSIKEVWAVLKQKEIITIGYRAFAKNVKRHIRSEVGVGIDKNHHVNDKIRP